MDWLNAAGGAAQGILAGQLDLQQKAQFDFLQKQRQRALQQQGIEDAAEAEARAVRKPGIYEDEDRTGMAPDEAGPPVKPPKQVKVTDRDYARGQIAALSKGTAAQRTQALQLEQAAMQREQFEFQMHQQQVVKAALETAAMADTAPHVALQKLAQHYDMVPDGQKLIVQQSPNGGWIYGVADQSGRWVPGYAPRAVTPEEVRKMAGTALQYASPQMYSEIRNLNTRDRATDIAQQNADTQGRQVDNQGNLINAQVGQIQWNTTGAGGQSELDYRKARTAGEYADSAYKSGMLGIERDKATMGKMGAVIQGTDTATGETVYGIPVTNAKGTTVQRINMPGFKPSKLAAELTDFQKVGVKAIADAEAAGTLTPAGRDRMIEQYKLQPVFGQTQAEKDAAAVEAKRKATTSGGGPKKVNPKHMDEIAVIEAQLEQGGHTYGKRMELETRLAELKK